MRPHLQRRRLLQHAASGALALPVLPALLAGRPAAAATNAELRAKLKYQDQPSEGNSCTSCLEWLPGATPTAKGGCKQIPGDDQISPDGWCTLWNSL